MIKTIENSINYRNWVTNACDALISMFLGRIILSSFLRWCSRDCQIVSWSKKTDYIIIDVKKPCNSRTTASRHKAMAFSYCKTLRYSQLINNSLLSESFLWKFYAKHHNNESDKILLVFVFILVNRLVTMKHSVTILL